MKMIATSKEPENALKKDSRAWRPPAEAPTATMGKALELAAMFRAMGFLCILAEKHQNGTGK